MFVKNFTVQQVRVADLNIDEDYQRSLSVSRVRDFARNFDINAAGIILVDARNDGKMYVIDGGHRVAAAKLVNLEYIDAQVFTGLEQSGEAALFLAANNAARVGAYDTLRAAKTSGDQEAQNIVRICQDQGFEIAKSKPGVDRISAIASLRKCYKAGNLRSTLKLIRDSWSLPERTHSHIIKGVSLFLSRAFEVNPEGFDWAIASRILGSRAPAVWLSRISVGHKHRELAQLLHEAYNSRVRSPRKKI